MDYRLTINNETSLEHRITCFGIHTGSDLLRQNATESPPQRAWLSDHQGARSVAARIERAWPATVVAPQTGGASQSKWTRKSRPWNASRPTTVAASDDRGRSSREAGVERIDGLASEMQRSVEPTFSGGEEPETMAGRPEGKPCNHAVRKGSRIHGSPVQTMSGRGRPGGSMATALPEASTPRRRGGFSLSESSRRLRRSRS